MKSEFVIRERKKELVGRLESMKHDMAHTEVFGRLKKENSLFYGEWLRSAMDILMEIHHLSWVLEEPITKDIYELTRI